MHGHACVMVEHDGGRLVIDPGSWSDRTVLDAADAVLVTHEHVDHVVPTDLLAALARRPHAHVWAPGSVIDTLDAGGADLEGRLHRVRGGEHFMAAGLAVDAVGEWHAIVHPDVPRIHNVGYLIEGTMLHPGDSLDVPARAVDVLLTPVGAPWLKVSEVIDFVRAVAPRFSVPIHDALLSPVGVALTDRLVSSLGGATYRRLAAGEELTFG